MREDDEMFRRIGDEVVDHLTEWAGMSDRARVLDMGCGYGRLAHALQRRGFRGSYLGLDILRRHIGWCRKNLAGGRWRFEHLDVRSSRYNPGGVGAAEEVDLGRYAGPYDVIVAASLFTHLEAQVVRHYLRQFVDVLAPAGAIYATFFLLGPRSDRAGEGTMSFRHKLDENTYSEFADAPLQAVGYREDWLTEQFASEGLRIRKKSYGVWCPGATDDHYQDVFVLEKG